MNQPRKRKIRAARAVFASPRARHPTAAWLLTFAVLLSADAVFVGRYVPWLAGDSNQHPERDENQ